MPMFKRSMAVLLTIALIAIGGNYLKSDDDYVRLDAATSNVAEKDDSDHSPSNIFVYVTGAVNKPGVVELKSEDGSFKIKDAVNACDGLLPTADVDSFNMLDKVTDGQHIRIPERNIGKSTNSNENAVDSGGIVNINTAGREELETLNGIGPKMAERIIEYRQNNGPFKSIEEIKNVRGIGPKTFEKIKDRLST